MLKFVVLVNDGTMSFGGLGRARMLDTISVMAEDEAEARAKALAETGKSVYSVEQVFRYAITLRGHADKRKRETYYINSTTERQALSSLSYNPKTWDFARFSTSKKRMEQAIVKITKEAVQS